MLGYQSLLLSKLKGELIFLFFSLILVSCSDTRNNAQENILSSDEDSSQTQITQDSLIASPPEVKSTWAVYEGTCGLYQKHMVMELLIKGSEVAGTYFYTKHQKIIQLKGDLDTLKNFFVLSESYKGKTTGFMKFWIKNGEIEGTWTKTKKSTEKENLSAKLLTTNIENRADYKPLFQKFKLKHNISFYNGEDDEMMEGIDEIKIARIGNTHFSFTYDVIGRNTHLGHIEGLATMKNKNRGLYSDGVECELQFDFEKHLVDIKVKGDCSTYGGYYAHFGGTLINDK